MAYTLLYPARYHPPDTPRGFWVDLNSVPDSLIVRPPGQVGRSGGADDAPNDKKGFNLRESMRLNDDIDVHRQVLVCPFDHTLYEAFH